MITGTKNTGYFIYQFLYRGFTSLGILHHADDLSQHGIGPCFVGSEMKSPFLIHRSGIYLFAGLFVYGYRLTAEHAFIDV